MKEYEYLSTLINCQLVGTEHVPFPDNFSADDVITNILKNQMPCIFFPEMLKDNCWTEEQRLRMTNAVKKSVFLSLNQHVVIEQISKKIEDAAIPCLLMKGAILKEIYPKRELREMSDIDILVPEEQMNQVGVVLKEIGFSLSSSIKHHDVYINSYGVVLEVHRSLYDKTVDSNQYQYFNGFEKAKLKDNHKYIYEFCHEDFYIYMIAHTAKHFYTKGCGIRHLLDIYIYLSKYKDKMDMEYVYSELKKCGIYEFANQIENLAFRWMERAELSSFEEALYCYMNDFGVYGNDNNGIWNKFADDKRQSISKMELKRWYYFPPLYYMSEYYDFLEKMPWLLPVAWMIRFFRGIFLHRGEEKREMVDAISIDDIATYKEIYQRMKLNFTRR